MPVNKIGGSSIWIRRRQAARPRDLRSGGCKDWRQMFHERGAEAAGSHEETRRIAVNIAKLPELLQEGCLIGGVNFPVLSHRRLI
jgi:hypothetical protein